jgi:hypothetical protein
VDNKKKKKTVTDLLLLTGRSYKAEHQQIRIQDKGLKKKSTADTGGQQVVRIKLQQIPHQVVRITLHQIPEVNRLLGVVVVDPVLG